MKCERCKKKISKSNKYCKKCKESLIFSYVVLLCFAASPWIILILYGILLKNTLEGIFVPILFLAIMYWPLTLISVILFIYGIVKLIKLK